jgi:hypothetical protein
MRINEHAPFMPGVISVMVNNAAEEAATIKVYFP